MRTAEPSLDRLGRHLADRPGTVMIVGAVDTGKSTLVRMLLQSLLSAGVFSALVDADIGQSTLGIPGTMAMKTLRTPTRLNEWTPDRVSFIGVLNPADAVPLIIGETKRLVDAARRLEVDAVLIDTDGLIAGEAGRALKGGQMRAVRPRHLVALQREDEAEHILAVAGDTEVHRLRPSAGARARSKEERREYRRKKYDEYFDGAEVHSLPSARAAFSFRGEPVDIRALRVPVGTLVGLRRGEDTIAFGVFRGFTDGACLVMSPLESIETVDGIVIGDIVL